jgi:hypothetical protein
MSAPKRSLFDISAELRYIEDALEANEGEITPELEAWFADLADERDTKINNYCWLIDELQNHAKFLREEAARFNEWAKANENKATRLKDRLLEFFQAHGLQKMVTPHFKPRIQANGGLAPLLLSVLPEELPKEFQCIRIAANQDELRRVLASGQELEFARIGERGIHLRLK